MTRHPIDEKGLPPAYGGCTCSCHCVPGIMHIAACCHPGPGDLDLHITKEWFERKVALEQGDDIGAGTLAAQSTPTETEKPAPDGLEVHEFVRKLRDFEKAYSTEFFAPLTEAEKDGIGDFLLSRASVEMGRHLAKFLTQAADRIDQAQSLIAELRGERDIAERNRDAARDNFHTMQQAADKLRHRAETAEAEVKRLTEALEQISKDEVHTAFGTKPTRGAETALATLNSREKGE